MMHRSLLALFLVGLLPVVAIAEDTKLPSEATVDGFVYFPAVEKKPSEIRNPSLGLLSHGPDGNKAIRTLDDIYKKPLLVLPLTYGGAVSKNAKTWKQVGKHTAAMALIAACWYAGRAYYTGSEKAGRQQGIEVMRQYFTGMFVGYSHSALFNFVDKGAKPAWMNKAAELAQKKINRRQQQAGA